MKVLASKVGGPVINFNNIYNNIEKNLVIRAVYSEPGRDDEAFAYREPVDVRNNWWGISDKNKVLSTFNLDDIKIEIDPISQKEFSDIGPDWSEFAWLYE